jgi:DNA topoisomerase-6 subunit B
MATIAEDLAKKQKEISVAEFFERNKHILGFDNPQRALLTGIKETADNALDACDEANIPPEILIEIRREGKDEYRIIVEDNGPGIVKKQIPNVFGRLLYGSRFHSIRQSRGQQGIGVSAVVMYGQLTTGKPAVIKSKIGPDEPTIFTELKLDTKHNVPEIIKEDVVLWEKEHGTRAEITIAGRYVREGKQSPYEYIKSTAIVNPHARITLIEPDGTKTIFERATDKMPDTPKEIKPHPQGIELGTLMNMLKYTTSHKLSGFLVSDFSRIGSNTSKEICTEAKVDENTRPKDVNMQQAKMLLEAFKKVKIMAPPTDCLSPIRETLLKRGLRKEEVDTEFIITVTREPAVYSGNPFQVEAAIAYGGSLSGDQPVKLLRFANRVPLLYQQGGCAITHAVEGIDWRRYGLEQRGGRGIPVGPAIFLVHVASTNVAFTSEAKEALADIPEVLREIDLALRDCARKMNIHIRKKAKISKIKEKEVIIRKILPLIAERSAKILGKPVPPIEPIIAKIMDNVMIENNIEFIEKQNIYRVQIVATNYTNSGKNFNMRTSVPKEAKIQAVEPKGSIRGNVIQWDTKKLASNEKRVYQFELTDLEKGDYDECEVYVEGVDQTLVSGAEVVSAKNDDDFDFEQVVTTDGNSTVRGNGNIGKEDVLNSTGDSDDEDTITLETYDKTNGKNAKIKNSQKESR